MKIRQLAYIGICLMAVVFLAGFCMAGEVSQGKCVSFEKESKIIKMEELGIEKTADAPYGKPTGKVLEFNTAKAKIGKTPAPGDVLRISYVKEGDANMALKVMNVSKQDPMKK